MDLSCQIRINFPNLIFSLFLLFGLLAGIHTIPNDLVFRFRKKSSPYLFFMFSPAAYYMVSTDVLAIFGY